MAKKGNKGGKSKMGKYLLIGAVIGLIIYILSLMKKGQTKVGQGCYVFEETHPKDANSDWICMHNESRPVAGSPAFTIGGNVLIKDTAPSLDGTYEVLGEWVDASGRQACLEISHNYDYVFQASQGGDPRDVSFFNIGRVCAV